MPILDTYPAHGAKAWEATQIYAPYLLVHEDTVYNFYNANSGHSEQSGLATLPLAQFPTRVFNTTRLGYSIQHD